MSQFKLTMRALLSENDDYSDPTGDTTEVSLEETDLEHEFVEDFIAPTAGARSVLQAGDWDKCRMFYVENKGTDGYIDVAWTDSQSASLAHRLTSGGAIMVAGDDMLPGITSLTVQGEAGKSVQTLVVAYGDRA